jgi:hypothetical protein
MTKNPNILQAIGWIIAGLAVAYLLWSIVPGYFQVGAGPRSAQSLRQEAEQMNRGLPALLDKETELMVTEGARGMFIYKYRLVNVSAAGVDHKNFAAGAKSQLVKMSCSQREMRGDFLSRGVTMRYSYFDKDKQPIATIDVTPADCGL